MFLTDIKDFDYRPLNNRLVENQSVVKWLDEDTGVTYSIYVGFICNLMSYPWLAGWLFDKLDNGARPSMLHDFLVHNDIGDSMWRDWQFYLAMRDDGAGYLRAKAAYFGLRFVSGHSGKKIR